MKELKLVSSTFNTELFSLVCVVVLLCEERDTCLLVFTQGHEYH